MRTDVAGRADLQHEGGLVSSLEVRPDPTPEEVAAIVAAVELLWPRPARPAPRAEEPSLRWRFSGRWWSRPTISRRDRPWVGPAS